VIDQEVWPDHRRLRLFEITPMLLDVYSSRGVLGSLSSTGDLVATCREIDMKIRSRLDNGAGCGKIKMPWWPITYSSTR
jgi:hypothetical protein